MSADRPVTRRDALQVIAASGVAAGVIGAGCGDRTQANAASEEPAMTASTPTPSNTTPAPVVGGDAVTAIKKLGFMWETRDPFLFCVHHDDRYPKANAQFGPDASLAGRRLGNDFEVKDGFRMYHGEVVPGFPAHPHRGFETVTVVRDGLMDHADSMGASARYGGGDTQWLTTGKGIMHAEMFPLLDREAGNRVELFQIWLNLPKRNKMVTPYFAMLWRETIPHHVVKDANGTETTLTVIAGRYEDVRAPAPPPDSWASQPEGDVAIWTLKMAPNARFTLPAAKAETLRSLNFFAGSAMTVGGKALPSYHQAELRGDAEVTLQNGPDAAELLMLQGRPIGEPVARHGPFVMNTQEEIRTAFSDYRRTQFGGWPWDRNDPVHGADDTRFARHADGREDKPA
ncbi:MAG: redox-sensitive bicupin YhaK (pirin superfamily) [Myxococcota bacterium]|jgi:redox-sensitive bicupin YhaK (pirin superfamily)